MLMDLPPPLYMAAVGFGRLRRPAFDARAATELAKFDLPFYPSTRYALAPSALLTVVNEIIVNSRRQVLELGAGVSTIYLARAAMETGGAVVSVEADAGWLAHVQRTADAAGVAASLTLVHAPLTAQAHAGSGCPWYEPAPIRAALDERKVDLMLVDGPVASGANKRRSRFPAGPELAAHLADDCAVFLDDLHRLSHRRIVRDWAPILGMRFTISQSRGGFAYGVRGRAFDPIM